MPIQLKLFCTLTGIFGLMFLRDTRDDYFRSASGSTRSITESYIGAAPETESTTGGVFRVKSCLQLGDVFYLGIEYRKPGDAYGDVKEAYATRAYEIGEIIPGGKVNGYRHKAVRGKEYVITVSE